MNYIKPQDVEGATTDVRVIYDGGENDYSVAFVKWKGKDKLAVRWNGDSQKQLGFPVIGKNPLWFILPEGIAKEGIKNVIPKIYANKKSI